MIDAMKGTASPGSGAPAGNDNATFVGAERVPECPPDPMPGKGGRKFPRVRSSWKITGGSQPGKGVICEPTKATGTGSKYSKVAEALLGRTPTTDCDLGPTAGKEHLITAGPSKPGSDWQEVTKAMLKPEQ